uniref:Calcium-binding tyrosine phosphorylation-regulated protein n=2 Tax=Chrysemys picta bellii TaxID=8478 RepID=A0A8C3IU46_CHRPI|nr:calcium-binding tyrosine phosphorylation-regulated protein isoform X1 [Chrysemys picta bellii]XP_023955342.1 calcium-binding tyrosine phosphorylation-regulated protein isoform X1 [Chrysemys picta bellii]
MHSSKPRLVVPYGLKTLLEGVSRAVLKTNPSNITEFAALYFRELIAFREENPNLDITDLIREFHFTRVEGWTDRLPEKRADLGDVSVVSPLSEEPKRKEKSTDTEEDQLHEGPEPEYSSKITQYPSTHGELAENEPSPTGPEASPKGPELAYVPADPAQLAAQMLGNIDSVHSMKDVATSVQSFPELSLSSVDTTVAPVEGAAEEATLTPAAEGSAESVRLEPAVQSQASIVLGSSSSQAEQSTSDVDQASSTPLQDEPPPPAPPPPPPPPPPPKDPLQAVPSQSEIEVTSTIQAMPIHTDDEPATEGEVPPYIEQFPQQIVIPFLEQVACLIEIQQPMPSLNTGQFTCTKILDPSADDAEFDPERMETTAQMASPEQGFIMSAMATTEAGQPPPYSNVWTLYCLTDLSQQGRKSPPPLPPAGTGAPYPQATLYISSGKEQQPFLQQQLTPQGPPPPQVSSPTYVMMEEGKRGNAPPFILVGSTVQNVQDWKSIPGHAVLTQHDTSAVRRFTTVPVPVARPADLKMATPNPNSNSAQETARPPTPVFLSVAIPLDEVMSAKRGSAAGDKAGINPFAGSYGIAGEITFTSAPVRRADS